MRTIAALIFFLISSHAFTQGKWKPYAGLHVSMDGAGYYVGPSYQAGTDYAIKKRLAFSIYINYFPNKLYTKYNDGSDAKWKYKATTAAVLLQKSLSKKEGNGWLLAGGVAFQKTTELFIKDLYETLKKRNIITLAARCGYIFTLKQNFLSIEINATGPHFEKDGIPPYYSTTTEFLTQLSLGVRFLF